MGDSAADNIQKKKEKEKPFSCYDVEGEKFQAAVDDVFRYNWWEVFCFPYILCSRLWECCVTVCAGANQCLIYWMIIQWIVCKITKFTTPDPIVFPYYFNIFAQTVLATVIFLYLWSLFGNSVLIPYLQAYYTAMYGLPPPGGFKVKNSTSRTAFRRYCFRKGEIFDTPEEDPVTSFAAPSHHSGYTLPLSILVDMIMYTLVA